MIEELNGIVISHKPISETSLKRLLLIFDKLHFLHPSENNFLIPDNVAKMNFGNRIMQMTGYGLMYNGESYRIQENQLLDKFDYASNKGIVKILNLKARRFYERNWLPLRLAYDFDTGNAQLLNNFLPLTIKSKEIIGQTGILRGGFISPANVKIYPDIPEQASFFSEEENKQFDLDHQLMSIAGRLNRTLAVCQDYDLIPIFINENLARAYSYKIELAKINKDIELNNLFFKEHQKKLINLQFLLHKISEIILPDEILNQISVKELIYARNNTFQECIKLRRKLIKTISFLNETEFDDEFIDEVNKYIKMELEPLVQMYCSSFVEKINSFLKYSLTFAGSVTGAVIGIQQNLSPMGVAYLSGISATVGSVTSNLTEYVLRNRYKKRINTFSYFINLRE
jgi:hypothetical protein